MDKEVKKKVKDRIIDTIIDIVFIYIAIFRSEELSQKFFHSDNILLVIVISAVIYTALFIVKQFITAVYHSFKKADS